MTDLVARRGDSETYELTLRDRNGNPLDLDTLTAMWFTVKRSPASPDADSIVQKTLGSGISVVDADAGTATVDLAPGDLAGLAGDTTIILTWDLQTKDVDGRIETPDEGAFTVELDVTHATT